MSTRIIDVEGHNVAVAEAGDGAPLVWLHGFADVHGASAELLPFHRRLAESFRLIAPAHPGCADSEETDAVESIHDVVAHYLGVLDALGLDAVHLAGSCVGGWVAAEIAVRHPQRVTSLALVGATGLFVPSRPIGDIFWVAQPEDGVYYNDLRRMLFASHDSDAGKALFPDGRGEIAQELLRYKMFRFASQVGFTPPYLYRRKLREQLARYKGPALILWGEKDGMVPREHGQAYADGLPAARLAIVPGAGHAAHVEKPDETAALIRDFVSA